MKYRPALTLAFALALAAAPSRPAFAQKPDEGKVVLETWDSAFLQGQRCGHVHTTTLEFQQNKIPLYETTVELRLKIRRFTNEIIDLGMDTGSVETADGRVVAVVMRQQLAAGQKREIIGLVKGSELKLTLDRKTPLLPAPWRDGVVGLWKQQTLFKDKAVKPGEKFKFASFEPTVNLVLNQHVTIGDFQDVTSPATGKKLRLLKAEIKPDKLEKVQLPTLVAWLDAERRVMRQDVEIPGLGTIQLLRTNKTDALKSDTLAKVADIGFGQLVRLKRRLPGALDSAEAVYRITIEGDDDPASTFSVDDGRQSVGNVQGKSFDLTVRSPRYQGQAGAAAAPGAEHTDSSFFITSADARVQELARRAVGLETDPMKKALRIERWVHDNVRSTDTEQFATADHVARTLKGDCTEFAMLTAAMCRASGVPSRTAVGLVYAEVKGTPAFAFHMWTEVYVNKNWVPLDATLGRGFVGAAHLKITDQTWHNTRDMTPIFPVLRVLGRVSVEPKSSTN